MGWRTTLAAALLIAIALVALLVRGEPGERDVAGSPPAPRAPEPTVSPAPAAPAEEAERSAVAPVPESDGEARRERPEVSVDASPRLATLVVRVRSADHGGPVAGLVVSVPWPEGRVVLADFDDPPRTSLGQGATTDAEGRAVLELPPGGPWKLLVREREAFDPLVLRDLGELAPGEQRELEVEVPTELDGSLRGRVLAEEDDAPIAGATVRLVRDGWRERVVLQETVTDSAGVFSLRFASWRSSCLEARADGYGVRFAHAEDSRILRLRRAGRAAVSVVDGSGTGVRGVRVVLSTGALSLRHEEVDPVACISGELEWSAETGIDGRCLMTELPAGVLLAAHFRLAGEDLPTMERVVVLEPGVETPIEAVLDRSATVRGVVVDQTGAAVAGCETWLVREDEGGAHLTEYFQPLARSVTGFDGSFSFERITPGTYWVGVAPDGEPDLSPSAARVEVDPSGASGLVVTTTRGLTIEGRVLGPDGAPAADAHVVAGHLEHGGSFSTELEEDGRFVLRGLAPGTYRVAVACRTPGVGFSVVEVEAGAKDLEFRLRAGGSLAGEVVVAATGGPARAAVHVFPSTASAEVGSYSTGSGSDGAFEMTALSPGLYDVYALRDDGFCGVARDVRVTPGRPSTARVAIEEGARLAVRNAGEEVATLRLRSDGAVVAFGSLPPGAERTCTVPAGPFTVERLEAAGGAFVPAETVSGVAERGGLARIELDAR